METLGDFVQSLAERYGPRPALLQKPGKTTEVWSYNELKERANRVADYMEFGELLARDALAREESCGAHFRTEYQTADGEAKLADLNALRTAYENLRAFTEDAVQLLNYAVDKLQANGLLG